MIENCRVCDNRLIKGDNYPRDEIDNGVGICDPCWYPIPIYISRDQMERYVFLRGKKRKENNAKGIHM